MSSKITKLAKRYSYILKSAQKNIISDGLQMIKWQQALQSAGFNPGKIDGIWGPRTSAATRTFQQFKGLSPTGIVDANTFSKLSSEVNKAHLDERYPTPQAPPIDKLDKQQSQPLTGINLNLTTSPNPVSAPSEKSVDPFDQIANLGDDDYRGLTQGVGHPTAPARQKQKSPPQRAPEMVTKTKEVQDQQIAQQRQPGRTQASKEIDKVIKAYSKALKNIK